MSRSARIYRVLIVDDNSGDHRLFQEAVAEMAYPIVPVPCMNAFEALDQLKSDSAFDLVLTDLNMPRMNGIELCEKIAAHPEWHRITTVIMSSNPKRNWPASLMATCNSPYLVKPTSWRDYIDLIRDLYVLLRDGAGSGRFRACPVGSPHP